jgi:hypothetical protein
MLQGKCPRCGERYYGFALANPEFQSCGMCGADLTIQDAPDDFATALLSDGEVWPDWTGETPDKGARNPANNRG